MTEPWVARWAQTPLREGTALQMNEHTPGFASSGLPLENRSLVVCFLTPEHLKKAFCCQHQGSFKIYRTRNELIVEKQKLLDEGFSFLVQAQ